MSAWITAHAAFLTGLLSTIVAVDHILASSSFFAANSTAQAVLGWISKGAGWVADFITPAPPAPPSPPAVPSA